MWLSFKFQLSAAPNGHVILVLRIKGKVNSHYTGHKSPEAKYSGCIALLSLYLGARWGWVVNGTPWPFYHLERPGTISVGGWLGPRVGLDGCGQYRHHWDAILRLSIAQQVAIPTMLYQSINKEF